MSFKCLESCSLWFSRQQAVDEAVLDIERVGAACYGGWRRRAVVDGDPHDDEGEADEVETAEFLVEEVLGYHNCEEVGREQ